MIQRRMSQLKNFEILSERNKRIFSYFDGSDDRCMEDQTLAIGKEEIIFDDKKV